MTIRLDSLTIRAFRGIRGEERFDFGGQNSVILGPNGSGKSTVLQAIEFLLTGKISALTGSGTGGIRPTEHVPNQYANPDETAVRARFTTDNGESLTAVREFSHRSQLQASDRPRAFRELVTAANQGLIHLSRDELLELVIATPGNRKDQIYHLMDTEGLDGRRKQLKRLAKNAADEADTRSTRYEENLRRLQQVAGDDVVTIIDEELELRPRALLDAVNTRRDQLGGDPIASLDEVDSFDSGLTSPLEQASDPLQRDDVQQRLTDLDQWMTADVDSVAPTLERLQDELRALRADEAALDMLTEQSLVHHGLDMVDDTTTACPLCKEPWEPTALREHLGDRADRLARIDERIATIDRFATDARNDLEAIRTTIDRLVDALTDADLEVDCTSLGEYRDALAVVVEALSGDITDDPEAVPLDALDLPRAPRSEAARAITAVTARKPTALAV